MFQTRSEITGIRKFHTMKEAIEYAKDRPDVWKISFGIRQSGERIRLVRFAPEVNTWTYAPITDVLDEVLRQQELQDRPSSERR
jgi:hypothetical protein